MQWVLQISKSLFRFWKRNRHHLRIHIENWTSLLRIGWERLFLNIKMVRVSLFILIRVRRLDRLFLILERERILLVRLIQLILVEICKQLLGCKLKGVGNR